MDTRRLRFYLPDHMTKEHERAIDRISQQFASRGWPKEQIVEFWQRKINELNGFCPLEAVCNDKIELAQLAADKTLKRFDDMIYDIEAAAHEEQRRIKQAWDKDDSVVDIKLVEDESNS